MSRRTQARALVAFAAAVGLCLRLAAAPDPPPAAGAGAAPVSKATEECLDCHASATPGIVAEWRASRHAQVTPQAALGKPKLERRVSSEDIPESLRTPSVGCFECHGLNAQAHQDNFEHFNFRINVVVSPNDCKVCHGEEARQYEDSKKAHAHGNLQDNPVYHMLMDTLTGERAVKDGALVPAPGSDAAKANACFGCHGTRVTVEGKVTVENADLGEIELPKLGGWPNQGVGRVNPDGSRGACTACHPRHGFSIEVARKPYTCAQCHLDPDVPAWNVYTESKHGNLFLSVGDRWNWEAVPWTVGKDFTAPTCATCHNALVVGPDHAVLAPRTHDFGARLYVRLFGLPYAHPQPKRGQTSILRNQDGQPLPTAFTGEPAAAGLIDAPEQARRRAAFLKICTACHATPWAAAHFDRMDRVVEETNRMTLAATQLVQQAWDRGLADRTNPFDESIERLWTRQWLFYANSIRYAAAMGGPDYATFKNGWWELTENLQRMHDEVRKGK